MGGEKVICSAKEGLPPRELPIPEQVKALQTSLAVLWKTKYPLDPTAAAYPTKLEEGTRMD